MVFLTLDEIRSHPGKRLGPEHKSGETTVGITSSSKVDEVLVENATNHEDASDYVWDSAAEVSIQLNGDSIAVDGGGVTVDGRAATITSAGTYNQSGSLDDGQILVNTEDEGIVRLILDGADIHSSTSVPFYILQMSADLAQADLQRKWMTADITHDLSTPLQVISGYLEILEEGEVDLTPERMEIIKTELGHLRRLVGDLPTLTQVEAHELEIEMLPVLPSVLLEQIYHTYQPIAARQGVDLVLSLSERAPLIQADEGRMLQVLKNLVENALRYTPSGGNITLSVVAGERVQLRVSDTGSGIDPEDLPYVFDRFYRADKARGVNIGKLRLGLAISKVLVNAQGGVISTESGGKGQGATMVITFDHKIKTRQISWRVFFCWGHQVRDLGI